MKRSPPGRALRTTPGGPHHLKDWSSSADADSRQPAVPEVQEVNMEPTLLAASVLVLAGAIVWSMLNAREHPSPE
jgi:hypothetical protein